MADAPKQFWQERLFTDILDADNGYDRKYVLPRGAGATTFVVRLVRELSVLLADQKSPRVVVVVKNWKIRNFVTSYLGNTSPLAALTGQSANEFIDVISADAPRAAYVGKYASYIDWLIVDNAEDSEVVNYFMDEGFTVNNRLVFSTC